jgi:hypothetical protein
MQNSFKVHSELIFIFAVLFHFVCYGLDALLSDSVNWYGMNFELLQNIVDLTFLLIIWGFSKNWGFIAKRCLATVVLLMVLNIIDSVYQLTNYYFFYFTILILNFTYALIYYIKWK